MDNFTLLAHSRPEQKTYGKGKYKDNRSLELDIHIEILTYFLC